MRLSRPADVDDARALQLGGEHVDDEIEDVVVEHAEGTVDEHPRWILQQDPRDGETEPLKELLGQVMGPARTPRDAKSAEGSYYPRQPQSACLAQELR